MNPLNTPTKRQSERVSNVVSSSVERNQTVHPSKSNIRAKMSSKKIKDTRKRKSTDQSTTTTTTTNPVKLNAKQIRKRRKREQARAAMAKAKEESKKKSKFAEALGSNGPQGTIICPAEETSTTNGAADACDFFWEIESIVGKRYQHGRVQYLVRWKNCPESENTWEPRANLCDTALEEASKYDKQQKEKERQRQTDENKLFACDTEEIPDESEKSEDLPQIQEKDKEDEIDYSHLQNIDDTDELEKQWNWTDSEQVKFKEIERIDVNDPNAKDIITEARLNGVPVVLIGHVGWPNFMKRWLVKKEKTATKAVCTGDNDEQNVHENQQNDHPISCVVKTQNDTAQQNVSNEEENDEPLNLAHTHYSWELDIQKMIDDIGNEDVPIVRRNYKESNPIHGNILASKFLTSCWLDKQEKTTKATKKDTYDPTGSKESKSTSTVNSPKLYLHQWQFPLSDTAGRKLCHQCDPLPNDIFGEDLLRYWIDLPQCESDNPLQYIFMGKEGTMSKLHKDNGGLAITIAPIVGEKECVLVHRADGNNCLYHLSASIEKEDSIDLHKYPLVAHARIWKTIVKPGEILLMPQGTYHQCRNTTPCLSYSRFYLDTTNLLPFLQSMIDGDAPELEHDDLLWNASSELIKKVDQIVDETQIRVKSGKKNIPRLTHDIVRTVNTLRSMRNIIREISRRLSIRNIVKGNRKEKNDGKQRKYITNGNNSSVSDKSMVNNGLGETIVSKDKRSINIGNDATFENRTSSIDWDLLVDDIDLCLHDFRFRRMEKIPPFRKRKVNALSNPLGKSKVNRVSNDEAPAPVVAYKTELELAYLSLPKAVDNKGEINGFSDKIKMIDEVEVGDKIVIKLGERKTRADVLDIMDELHCAYVSFDDYPSLYDEYLPYYMLRLPNSGGINTEIPPDKIKAGLVVIALLGEKREVCAKHKVSFNLPLEIAEFN